VGEPGLASGGTIVVEIWIMPHLKDYRLACTGTEVANHGLAGAAESVLHIIPRRVAGNSLIADADVIALCPQH